MKYLICLIFMCVVTGCSFDLEYQTAINNYSKSECDSKGGKLLYVSTTTVDGTVESYFRFECVTSKGIETFTNRVKNIPVQYWSKNEN